MSVEAGAAAGVASAADSQLAILAALAIERATLPPAGSGPGSVAIWQCGPGAERAAAAARTALACGATALVSWGFAGALVADVAPGTVALPRALVTRSGAVLPCDPAWHAALAAALAPDFAVDERPLLGATRALGTPAEKAAGAGDSGAATVDMESAAIAAVAARAGARFAAVRVVVDALGDALPADPERWIDAHGNRRLAAALGAVLTPRDWPLLWTLSKRYRVARGVLVSLAERLGSGRFLLPDAR